MTDTPPSEPSRHWVAVAAAAADSKQGDDIVVLDVGGVLAITDWFMITSGRNARQVRTIVDEVERQITEAGGPKPLRIEGLDDLHWVLIDYGEFVIHVFHEETRHYYELERLWRDVPHLDPAPAARAD